MKASALRRWVWVHKWASLVCTLFLLVICVTGLPLLFAEQIDQWLDPDPPFAVMPAGTPHVSLDLLTGLSLRMFPGHIITSVGIDQDNPEVTVAMAPSWKAWKDEPDSNHWISFDARTAKVVEQSKPPSQQHIGFLGIVYQLHTALFADLPGQIFMALMAALFVAAIVSGVVLYGPFMRRLAFGTVRTERGERLRWLDVHNLLGVVTLGWVLVVGATGIMNELSTPLFALWQQTTVRQVLAHWQDQPTIPQSRLSSAQAAYGVAQRALPSSVVTGINFPRPEGSGGPHNYLLWSHGATPLTARLFNPVLVDAETGKLTAIVTMPWYLRALEVSRPLHFGDYGGMPLKIIWGLLDIVTILVLGSGLYLWLSRRKSHLEAKLDEVELAEAEAGLESIRSAAE